jgi:hypothetical protein
VLSQVAIITGVEKYNDNTGGDRSPLGIAHIIIFFAIWLIVEVWY